MQTLQNGTRLLTAMVILAALSSARPIFAVDVIDDPVQIQERVTQVMQTSNSLCWEMYRYHQQQPGYPEAYRQAKDIWTKASQLRDALLTGPLETEALLQQASDLNQNLTQLEKTLSLWGAGDRSSFAANGSSGQRTFVSPGVGVDIPFVGIRVGGPSVVVTDDGFAPLQRLRLHANSRGSKRSLERELAAVKVAVSYLLEDASVTSQPHSPTPAAAPDEAGPELGPVPQPPKPDTTLESSQAAIPPSPAKP